MDENEFEIMLQKYADVAVRIGLNLRSDQRLLIRAGIDDAPFIRKVTASAYKAGARFVDVQWADEQITRIRLEHADPETLSHVPDWMLPRYEEYYQRGDASLAIASSDPGLLAGIDSDRIATMRRAVLQKVSEPLRKYENLSNWCVMATAAPAWAKKVFPDLPTVEAQMALWDAIFKACRVDQPDPVQAWEEHVGRLTKYKDYLTHKQYAALHYKAPGTDLTLGLAENHQWLGAQESFKNGVTCVVNIPTEEVFTAPHKDKADGHITASMPLNISGVLIEDFSLTFEGGRAVKISAKKGEADLRKLLETDGSAAQLGEAALVPHSSPISRSGIMFYNTLFDENASCHIAFGNAYRNTIAGGEDMSDEEFSAKGGNKSMIHTDFMVGSAQMDIDGIYADGSREPVMRGGEWAFTV